MYRFGAASRPPFRVCRYMPTPLEGIPIIRSRANTRILRVIPPWYIDRCSLSYCACAMAAGADNADDEVDDEGMDDPLVLRGLLQCLGIGLFHAIRYVMDVLFTPHIVQAVPRQVESIVHRLWTAISIWYAPIMCLLLLHLGGSLDRGILAISARWMLWCCILRAVLTTLMDDTMIVGQLRKRHAWVPLVWWVTFTRVSSGREQPRRAWQRGYRHHLCCMMPWVLRLGVLWASWPTLLTVPRASHQDNPFDQPQTPLAFEPARQQRFNPSPQHFDEQACTSFSGFPVPCEELHRIREFNSDVMPRMHKEGYRGIRKAMNERGFHGHVWHVGHACPDPSKKSMRNEEDFGWNLFAQHAVDNAHLGHCLVSCTEAEHVGAYHVRCTRTKDCVQTCTTGEY